MNPFDIQHLPQRCKDTLAQSSQRAWCKSGHLGTRLHHWLRGCYNAFTHPHEKRTLVTPDTIAEWVSSLEGIEGVSFSGGEPFEQAKAVRETIVAIREKDPNLTFFSYSGFDVEGLQHSKDEEVAGLLNELDMLSAGPYVHSKRQTDLLWRGSTNQKLHYLTRAYREEQELEWELTSPVEEFQFDGEIIHFTGFEGNGSKVLKAVKANAMVFGV